LGAGGGVGGGVGVVGADSVLIATLPSRKKNQCSMESGAWASWGAAVLRVYTECVLCPYTEGDAAELVDAGE